MEQKKDVRRRQSRTFVRRAPEAKTVRLSGTFNGWDPEATPLRKQRNGMWTVTIELEPGRYEYKYVVDGRWLREEACEENDRGCPHCVPNAFGSKNCVLSVG